MGLGFERQILSGRTAGWPRWLDLQWVSRSRVDGFEGEATEIHLLYHQKNNWKKWEVVGLVPFQIRVFSGGVWVTWLVLCLQMEGYCVVRRRVWLWLVEGAVYNVSLFNLVMWLLCVFWYLVWFLLMFLLGLLFKLIDLMWVYFVVFTLWEYSCCCFFSLCYFCEICSSSRSNPAWFILCIFHCSSLLYSLESFVLYYWGIGQTWFAIWRVHP